MPSEEEIEKGDLEEDELEMIEEQVEMDYQIGEDLKEKVLLMRVSYLYHDLTLFIFRSFPVPSITSPARPWSMRMASMTMMTISRILTRMMTMTMITLTTYVHFLASYWWFIEVTYIED